MNRLTIDNDTQYDFIGKYDTNIEEFTYNKELRIKVMNKLGKLEDLEEEIGIPLDVAFKALKEGIYIEENGEFGKYDVRGIGINGLIVISIYGYAECDFTCYYKDYKKTWWLKEDRSK